MIKRAADKITGQQRLVYTIWFIMLFDPQWILADLGLKPALKIEIGLVALLAATTLFNLESGDWLIGVAAWIGAAVINLPFGYNAGISMIAIKKLLVYYIVGIGLLRAIRTPRRAAPVIFMLCVGQYLWWAAWGLKSGAVSWHPDFSNFDGYGPLMACGIGPAYYFATATPNIKIRRWSYLASALCVIGVASSFARGAVLSLGVTVLFIWYRSPRRARTAGFIFGGLLAAAVAVTFINGKTRGDDTNSNFWVEMTTMFDQSDGSTGMDRKILWGAATEVFMHHPIFGAGANNFGPAAADIIHMGGIGGAYAYNPLILYTRALHNIFYQILSEYGLLGVSIFAYLMFRFWRITRALNTTEAALAWQAAGGETDIRKIMLGLEVGLVSYLANGYFYNTLFTVTLYSLLFGNALLWEILRKDLPRFRAPRKLPSAGRGRQARSAPGAQPARP